MESTLAAVARVACGLASAAMLLAWSPAIRSEPWTHSWGGSCTSSQIWHGAAPEDVARQYADALATCAPDDRPYFKYCDPPHVANSQFAVAGCYYHNTTPQRKPGRLVRRCIEGVYRGPAHRGGLLAMQVPQWVVGF